MSKITCTQISFVPRFICKCFDRHRSQTNLYWLGWVGWGLVVVLLCHITAWSSQHLLALLQSIRALQVFVCCPQGFLMLFDLLPTKDHLRKGQEDYKCGLDAGFIWKFWGGWGEKVLDCGEIGLWDKCTQWVMVVDTGCPVEVFCLIRCVPGTSTHWWLSVSVDNVDRLFFATSDVTLAPPHTDGRQSLWIMLASAPA